MMYAIDPFKVWDCLMGINGQSFEFLEFEELLSLLYSNFGVELYD